MTDVSTPTEQVSEQVSEPVEAGQDGTDAASSADGEAARASRGPDLAQLEREGDVAADYLEGLLDIADLDGDIDMDVEGDRSLVSIVGADLGQLVGPDGRVLDALQELTRLAVLRETGERSRLMLDISGYRAQRRAELVEVAAAAIEKATTTREPVALAPMTAFERKVVHDAVAAAGLTSASDGEDPRRHVVVHPA